MLNGIMLLWFVLTAMAVAFVAIDIRSTPESPVLKWGFILLTAYTGPIGAFLYVLGCREPLPGLHERYIATRWRQVLGSTMHCVAGDGIGILAGAAVASYLTLPRPSISRSNTVSDLALAGLFFSRYSCATWPADPIGARSHPRSYPNSFR